VLRGLTGSWVRRSRRAGGGFRPDAVAKALDVALPRVNESARQKRATSTSTDHSLVNNAGIFTVSTVSARAQQDRSRNRETGNDERLTETDRIAGASQAGSETVRRVQLLTVMLALILLLAALVMLIGTISVSPARFRYRYRR
jgi:hypothetical protein